MRLFVTVILIAAGSIRLQAQQDSTKKVTLTLAALYNSNISYYGQVTAEKMPYVLANATLRLPIGLYFSAGAYKLFNYGNGLSETDLGIGYEHEFNEKLSAGVAYTRFFFPANSPLLQASNENNLNVSATYLWSWLTTDFNADYAFGKQQDIFLSLNNSKEIELGTLFSDKNFLTLTPAVEIVAGTKHFYETYITEKIKRNQGKGRGASKTNTIETTLVPTNSFDLLAYNFKLPITLSRAKYMAEVSYQFSILGAKESAEVKTNQSFFGLAFYYQF